MIGVPGFGVIEGRDPHQGTRLNDRVVRRAGVETALEFKRPAPACPAGVSNDGGWVFALRQLRRTPGFALVTILTFGLGMGANAAVFSVMNAVVAGGIAANRLGAVGYGAEKPIADNRGEEGRAKNRRVELVKK